MKKSPNKPTNSRAKIERDMYLLLSGPSTEMANECERVYRNQVSDAQDTCSIVRLSGRGVFKARLFGVSFMLFAFARKHNTENAINEMMNASSGLAIEPLYSPGSSPHIDRHEAASFAGRYMRDVFKAISYELRDGPSIPGSLSEGFYELVTLWNDALDESFDSNDCSSSSMEALQLSVVGSLFANLRYLAAHLPR